MEELDTRQVVSSPALHTNVSIDWSKYELPSFTDEASDTFHTQETATAGPSSQVPQSSFSYATPFSQHSQAAVEEGEEDDADDDASLPSVTDLRENRFLGSIKNWRAFTRRERNIWKAFEIERSRDLSAHLFNAFALEKRALELKKRQPGIDVKGKAVADGNEGPSLSLAEPNDEVEEDEGATFRPGRHWTAWPMSASTVPREGEDMERNADDLYTITAQPDPRPSSNLEECLMSRMSKVARQRWDSREWIDDDKKRLAQEDPFAQKQQRGQSEVSDLSDGVYTQVNHSQSTKGDSATDVDSDDDGLSDRDGTHAGGSQPQGIRLQATFQTDDDKAYKILRPAARHILSRVDDLLLALHRARASYMNDHYGEEQPRRKRKKRPQVKLESKSGDDQPANAKQNQPTHELRRSKRSQDQRPRKLRARSKSAQNKSLAVSGEELRMLSDSEEYVSPSSSSSSDSDSELSGSSAAEESDDTQDKTGYEYSSAEKSDIKSRIDRIGLRDWSDILGTAALTGFPADAVERASARCARLFGEDMEFRTFETGRIRKLQGVDDESGVDSGHIFEYTEEPPDISEIGVWKWRRQQMNKRREKYDPRPAQVKGNGLAQETTRSFLSLPESQSFVKKAIEHKLMCPVATCPRAKDGNGFSRKWNLNQHVSKMHPDLDLQSSENRSQTEDSGANNDTQRKTRSRTRSGAASLAIVQEDPSMLKQE